MHTALVNLAAIIFTLGLVSSPLKAVPLPDLRPDVGIDIAPGSSPERKITSEPVTVPGSPAGNRPESGQEAMPVPRPDQARENDVESSEYAAPHPTLRPDPLVEAATTTAQDSGDKRDDSDTRTQVSSIPVLRPERTDDRQIDSTMALPLLRPAEPPPPSRIVSEADYFALRRIIALIREDSFIAAQAIIQTVESPMTRNVAEWLYLRDSSLHAGFRRIRAFIRDHPDWPSQGLLRNRIEAALFVVPEQPQTVIDYFEDRTPITGLGKAALARALNKKGLTAQAAILIRKAWSQYLLSEWAERMILRDFAEVLGEADHLDRLRYLLYRQKMDAARRAAKLAGRYGTALLNAHQTVGKRGRTARGAFARIPEAIKQDPVIVLRQAQALRRAGRNVEAAAVLIASAPHDQDALNADAWWPERRLLLRRMITARRPDLAHKLAERVNVSNPQYLADAEFLAGWVALRYLYDSDLAYFHFRKLRQSVTRPLSIARAEYWLGRTESVRGNDASAIIRYANAEKYPYTFYGQLAMSALGRQNIVIKAASPPNEAQRNAFEALDLTRAAILFHELGEHRLSRLFLVQNATVNRDGRVAAFSAELAESLGRPDTALRVGKAALARDELLYQAAHTINGLPDDYDQVSALEPALVYAVSRQESAFDVDAISRTGARGLMQLMPPTAREVSQELQIDYSLARLTQDPSYNVTLGATYMDSLIERFEGSYVMAIPSYNAGGGRVSRWIKIIGDPRDPLVDPIDWIERMPLAEPRDYVQRVLANLQIYRAILAGGVHRLALLEDLDRGKRTLAQ